MFTCSASTLDEEVGAAKLSCGLTEPARERGGGGLENVRGKTHSESTTPAVNIR